MDVGTAKVMRILREQSPLQITTDQKQLENVECFKCLGSMLTNGVKCACKIMYTIVMAKSAFNRKKTFHQQIGIKFKEQTSEVLHLEHSVVWC